VALANTACHGLVNSVYNLWRILHAIALVANSFQNPPVPELI